jgi:large subunit ribosomal protein L11
LAKKKEVMTMIKLQCPGGQATPAPPVGPALGQHGVNIGEFVQRFNERTRSQMGTTLPVVITVYRDRSFDFVVKTPPAAVLLKKAANVAQGAATPSREEVGRVTDAQLREIAELKMPDLNARDIEHAKRIIAGTARSMGITVETTTK